MKYLVAAIALGTSIALAGTMTYWRGAPSTPSGGTKVGTAEYSGRTWTFYRYDGGSSRSMGRAYWDASTKTYRITDRGGTTRVKAEWEAAVPRWVLWESGSIAGSAYWVNNSLFRITDRPGTVKYKAELNRGSKRWRVMKGTGSTIGEITYDDPKSLPKASMQIPAILKLLEM